MKNLDRVHLKAMDGSVVPKAMQLASSRQMITRLGAARCRREMDLGRVLRKGKASCLS
jgi:hypothetical protein